MHQSPATHRPPRPRRGFTLTELLVVIAIIAMLVALVSVGVMRAMDTAKQARTKVELDQIDLALKAYREKYGAYPPCDLRFNLPAVMPRIAQHVVRAFPRYNLGPANSLLIADLQAAGIDGDNFRPDQALVFWLRGFSPDPAHPFVTTLENPIADGSVTMGVKAQRTPLFDFDPTRLTVVNDLRPPNMPFAGFKNLIGPVPSYFPAGTRLTTSASTTAGNPFPVWAAGGAPLVYFDSGSYGPQPMHPSTEAVPAAFNLNITGMPELLVLGPDAGTVEPYWHDTNLNGFSGRSMPLPSDYDGINQPLETWANPDSFQLIAAGGDGKYGFLKTVAPTRPRCYPTGGLSYDISANLADDDNVTNFSQSARLGDAKP